MKNEDDCSTLTARTCYPCALDASEIQIYGIRDEAAHKAAGGLPVVRAAQTIIKAPVDEVALCWWQAGRRKASHMKARGNTWAPAVRSLHSESLHTLRALSDRPIFRGCVEYDLRLGDDLIPRSPRFFREGFSRTPYSLVIDVELLFVSHSGVWKCLTSEHTALVRVNRSCYVTTYLQLCRVLY